MADPDYINIGHSKLIEDRHEHPIIGIEGAGNLGEYVPFYFGPHSPMLLMIKSGSTWVTKRPQEDILYIISSLDRIKQANCEYCFSDKQAKLALANFYRRDEDLDKIDWEVVKAKYWKNDEHYLDRQDRKQAELLVRNAVPVSCIEAICVKSEERKEYIEGLLGRFKLEIKVYLDTNNKLYY